MSVRLEDLHPDVELYARLVIGWAKYYGIPVTVLSTRRTCAQQAFLFTSYLQNPTTRIPAARPGESAHQYGLAFYAKTTPQYQWAWDWLRQYVGFHLLGSRDPHHAEVPGWQRFVLRNPCE